MNEETQALWLARAADARVLARRIKDSSEERDLLALADMYELVVKRFRMPEPSWPTFQEWPPRTARP